MKLQLTDNFDDVAFDSLAQDKVLYSTWLGHHKPSVLGPHQRP